MKENPKIYSVSELNHLVQKSLEEQYSGVWIEGEVSNYRGASGSGHCYFSLKDEFAQVDIVAFRSVMASLRFKLEDGLKVLICGRVSLYTQRGRFQVIASALEPKGAGALQMAFEQLKKKLQAEGLFSPERKRPIPSLPQKIGIVTSPTGAAIKDILTVIDRRFANVEILIYPVKVQGEGAREDIARGVDYLNEHHPDLDVLLVGRGGGSIEDLWAFNEEVVARAIAASRIPVISCVGHEIDFTIADFVADLRAPTPSAAAELVVKNKAELKSVLANHAARLRQNLQSVLTYSSEKLKGMARSTPLSRPGELFEAKTQTVDELLDRMSAAFQSGLSEQTGRVQILGSKIGLLSPQNLLEERSRIVQAQFEKMTQSVRRTLRQTEDAVKMAAGRLEALSPLAVLSRGYAIAFSMSDDSVLRSSAQVSANDAIRVRLHQGEITAAVQSVKP